MPIAVYNNNGNGQRWHAVHSFLTVLELQTSFLQTLVHHQSPYLQASDTVSSSS